jgi:hypothetical protein
MGGKEIPAGSFDVAVTAQELQCFNDFAASIEPAKDSIGNNRAQGDSRERTKSVGLIYLISDEWSTLDQMIRFCDAVLSERNDFTPSPIGQHKIWTRRVDPVWLNTLTALIGIGGEHGDTSPTITKCISPRGIHVRGANPSLELADDV